MRILFFNRSFYPDEASTGQLLTELCEDLVRLQGYQVTVIAGPVRGKKIRRKGWGLFASVESHNGITILRTRSTTFSKESFTGRACNYISYFVCAFFTGWLSGRPDIVVSYTDPPIAGLAAWVRSRILFSHFVLVCQDIFPQVAVLLDGFRKGLLYELLDWFSWFLLYAADAVVAIGETMCERLVRIKGTDPSKIFVIHNWADSSAIVPGPNENEFAAAHGLSGKFVVMHSGNVGLSQSLGTLLEAAELLQPIPDICFTIIGDGASKSALQAKAKERNLRNVLFLPFQPKEKLSESFAAADVFVILLKKGMSGFIVPSKVYGILAAGRPFVAAMEEDCEVVAIANEFECGLHAKPDDARDLADKILELYYNREWVGWRGENARNAAVRYDRIHQTEKYATLFRKLTAGLGGGELGASNKERENEVSGAALYDGDDTLADPDRRAGRRKQNPGSH